jgi:RNA polymerase sigma-70 factor (ECF subfamily)
MEKTLELTFQQRDEDEELVLQVRNGDRTAFDKLFERHKTYVYNVCYRMLGSMEDARDATQNAFIRAFTSLPNFRGCSSFRTWIYRIAINVAVDISKRQKKAKTQLVMEQATANPEPVRETLNEAIGQLPPDHRAVLVLFYIQGLSGKELAEALGCSEGAARLRLHRARIALKAKYEELQYELQTDD